ncbi:hypothetical protein GQ42DRAFT_71273 [Ramicandelaber brevisporus]|nr:hypothetical protein GQ42DRAFT_71273 [Ramicandelaber brevisporus]
MSTKTTEGTLSVAMPESNWHYVRVALQPADGTSRVPQIGMLSARQLLATLIGSVHGAIGSGIQIDMLRWDEAKGEGLIRISTGDYGSLKTALSIATSSLQNVMVRMSIVKASPYAHSLAI